MSPNKDFLNEWIDFVPAFIQGKHHVVLEHLAQLRKSSRLIYPPQNEILNCLSFSRPQNISVVILGQDPYHGPSQAHGLAFSVPNHLKAPPSLKNILKEINHDIYDSKQPTPNHDLSRLAVQGVLLLNTVLSVEAHKPLSHSKIGWQEITQSIIQSLASLSNHLAVLLWGKHAQSYAPFFDPNKHLILSASHPSPLSAHLGFFGCKHFSQTNAWLVKQSMQPIIW